MPKPDQIHFEHTMSEMKNTVRVCLRCKGGLIYSPTPTGEGAFCMRKGCHNEGELFIRFEAIATFLRSQGVDIQKLYSEGKLVYHKAEITPTFRPPTTAPIKEELHGG